MLIMALLVTLSTLFAPGGPQLQIQDLTRQIDRAVSDAPRAARLVELNRAMRRQEADFQVALLPLTEKLVALYTDRLSTEADFATVTGQIDDLRSALGARLASEHFAMRALLNPSEWQAIYGPAAPATPLASATGK